MMIPVKHPSLLNLHFDFGLLYLFRSLLSSQLALDPYLVPC